MTLVALLANRQQHGMIRTTAYGDSAPIGEYETSGVRCLVTTPHREDPRATVRALKDGGATHLWLIESVGSLSPLLEPGDFVIPDDYLDGTRGQHYTYFSEKAGGYVQQVPPFDPASREALIAGAGASVPRPFKRGVYVCVSNTRVETPAEATFWTRAGGHIVGRYLSPYLTLARELEMQVAVLALVTRAGGEPGDDVPFETYAPVITSAVQRLGVTS